MKEKEIILTFNIDGTVQKETKGFAGKSCTKESAFIEEALGATANNRRYKKEFYDEEVEQKQKLRLGGTGN